MRIGLCTGVDKLEDACAAGYAYAELALAPTLGGANDDDYARLHAAMVASPLPIEVFNCFLPGELKVVGPTVDLPAVERYMERALSRTAEVGASVVVFGSGGARAVPEGFPLDRAREQLAVAARMAGDIAACHQLTIVMEPLFQCHILQRVAQGIAFVDYVNHPRVRLLADLFHMTNTGEPFSDLLTAGTRLKHMHLATPALTEKDAATRADDFPGFLAATAQAGYQGRITVEDNPGFFSGLTPPFTPVFRAMREYVEFFLTTKDTKDTK